MEAVIVSACIFDKGLAGGQQNDVDAFIRECTYRQVNPREGPWIHDWSLAQLATPQ